MGDHCVAITQNTHLCCRICLDTWKRPTELVPCRHVFCARCITEVVARTDLARCPVCREEALFTRAPSQPRVNMANDMWVQCLLCHWEGTREQSYTHYCGNSLPQARPAAATAPPNAAGATPAPLCNVVTASNTVNFSNQCTRTDLQELSDQPGILKVIAKTCPFLMDISAVTMCAGLVDINLAQCGILWNVRPLGSLPCLCRVDLSGTSVSDLSFVEWCLCLESLRLSDARALCAVDPLQACHLLKELYIDGTSVSSLVPLRGMSHLEILVANSCNQLRDLSPLEVCRNLRKVEVKQTLVSDVSPLRSCDLLTEVSVAFTPVTSLEPFARMQKLTTVIANNSQITDVTGLDTCPNLVRLRLNGTPRQDYKLRRRSGTLSVGSSQGGGSSSPVAF